MHKSRNGATMNQIKNGILAAMAILTVGSGLLLAGCDNSEVSRVPKPAEIEDAKQRRLAEVDKLNIPEQEKEIMRQRIRGSGGGASNPAQAEPAEGAR
jgi:hypothetical protein